jgi:hypothetical protein
MEKLKNSLPLLLTLSLMALRRVSQTGTPNATSTETTKSTSLTYLT